MPSATSLCAGGIKPPLPSSFRRPNGPSICTDGRNRRDDLLLTANDLHDETLAVKVSVLVERDVEQHPRGVLSGDPGAVQRCRQCLRVEFPDLFGNCLNYVDHAVAFHSVVIAAVLVFLLKLVVEGLDCG